MNPSIKRLLGALLLIGTLGVSCVLAITASALTATISHESSPAQLNQNQSAGETLNG